MRIRYRHGFPWLLIEAAVNWQLYRFLTTPWKLHHRPLKAGWRANVHVCWDLGEYFVACNRLHCVATVSRPPAGTLPTEPRATCVVCPDTWSWTFIAAHVCIITSYFNLNYYTSLPPAGNNTLQDECYDVSVFNNAVNFVITPIYHFITTDVGTICAIMKVFSSCVYKSQMFIHARYTI